MSDDVSLSLCPTVSIVETGPRTLTLESPAARITLADLTPGMLDAWRMLASTGGTERAIVNGVRAVDDVIAATLMHAHLRRCDELAFLQYSIDVEHRRLVTVVPMVTGFYFSVVPVAPAAPLRLSRFAYVRRLDDTMILESPLATSRAIVADDTGGTIIAMLAVPRTCDEVCALLAGHRALGAIDCAAVRSCLSLLTAAGFLGAVDRGDRLPEDADPALVPWEFHDLAFHARSRLGRHNDPFGGTFPVLNQTAPLPAVAPARSSDIVRLHAPDRDWPAGEEPSFSDVLESRRSVREHGSVPITATELGAFLFRTARVRELRPSSEGRPYESSSRPYPSGGGAYDLEVYVTVHTCDGLASGLYHYRPEAHQLERLTATPDSVAQLVRDAQTAAALTTPPQILITLASRFGRLSWKYRSMAYATTLKNVGVVFQTMYLVATAMGLAPCALGGGNSAAFAKAAGTHEFEESSVGEFLLGSRPRA